MYVTDDEQAIADAFKGLLDQGILAKPNHMCCMSCATASLGGELDQKPELVGIAYYHEQDDEGVREQCERGDTGSLYVGYSSREDGDMVAIGNAVKAALEAKGLTVEWNGDPGQRLVVSDVYFEPFAKCDTCYHREEECECCYSCDSYPCECCEDCGQGPDWCNCDEHCDDCGEHESDCRCGDED
jgi:hypothetical protein